MRSKEEIDSQIAVIEITIESMTNLLDESQNELVFNTRKETIADLKQRLYTLKWVIE